jgi:hypothetical protein
MEARVISSLTDKLNNIGDKNEITYEHKKINRLMRIIYFNYIISFIPFIIFAALLMKTIAIIFGISMCVSVALVIIFRLVWFPKINTTIINIKHKLEQLGVTNIILEKPVEIAPLDIRITLINTQYLVLRNALLNYHQQNNV